MAAGQFNTSYNDQIFTYTSLSASSAQFSYIADVYKSGSNDRLARIKTIPNASGVGVFNLASVFQANLDYEQNWKTEGVTENTQSSAVFEVQFGEEYSLSATTPITVYANQSSSFYTVFNGTSDPTVTNNINFNPEAWDTGSFQDEGKPRLSNYTSSRYVSSGSYETLSVFGGELTGGIVATGSRFYSASVVVIDDPSRVYNFPTDYTSSTPINVLTIGVGPQNFSCLSYYPYYDIILHYTGSAEGPFTASYRYTNRDATTFITSSTTIGNDVWVQTVSLIYPFGRMVGPDFYGGAAMGGSYHSAIANNRTRTQVYNGICWVAETFSTNNRLDPSGAGTVDDFGVAGGVTSGAVIQKTFEKFNGSTWSAGPDMNKERYFNFMVGDSADNLFAIASDPNPVGGTIQRTTEVYNGTSWSTSVITPTFYWLGAVIGTVNAASYLSSAGNNIKVHYEFDGVSWSSVSTLPFGAQYSNGAGTVNNILYFGGSNTSGTAFGTTQIWNGVSWSYTSDLVTSRYYHGAAGNPQGGLAAGGSSTTAGIYNTEEYIPNYQPVINENLPDTCYDETRFAFINQYGVWDYYSIFNPLSKTTSIDRQSFTKPYVDYNVSSPLSVWSVSDRGKETYHSLYQDKYQVTTDFLEQNEADWLTELIESPNVFLQEGTDFVPIVITNATYQWKTNPRGQKVFQYTIEFAYSNNRTSVY